MKSSIHFVLVPDRFASRLVKRNLAQSKSWLNVQVGTWIELLELSVASYCVFSSSSEWDELLGKISSEKDAFWYQSAQVAEQESVRSIAGMLNKFIHAEFFEPHSSIPPEMLSGLSSRCIEHVMALQRFWRDNGCPLPEEFSKIDSILETSESQPIRTLVVYHVPDFPKLSLYQKRLLQKLAKDAEGYEHLPQLQEILQLR